MPTELEDFLAECGVDTMKMSKKLGTNGNVIAALDEQRRRLVAMVRALLDMHEFTGTRNSAELGLTEILKGGTDDR